MMPALSLWRGPIGLRVSMKDICTEIASLYCVSEKDLQGPSRTKAISLARQHAMYLMAEQKHLSFPMIGKFLNRDHTTILHGVKAHKARVEALSQAEAA